MIQQGNGSICICDKCKKVINNMEYVQLKSVFPYNQNSEALTSNSRTKSFSTMEFCYECYDELIKSLFKNGFINEKQRFIILGKKKTILDDIKEKTK